MRIISILAFFQFVVVMSFAQDSGSNKQTQWGGTAREKGTVYMFWGWNRAAYTNSSIHFKGDDYDFKLEGVKASDRPTTFSFKEYLRPDRITIPQTNFRLGYFIKDNLAISLGVDHMKYVMRQNQTVNVSGSIGDPVFNDRISTGEVRLTEDFLTFEHTDGLNYINAEVEYYWNIFQYKFLKVNTLIGGGVGFLLPKTNAMLMSQERHDDFHLAGFGLDAKLGAEVLFWDLVFIRSEGKQGYINMPSIRTTHNSADKASQHFWFAQLNYTIGVSIKF